MKFFSINIFTCKNRKLIFILVSIASWSQIWIAVWLVIKFSCNDLFLTYFELTVCLLATDVTMEKYTVILYIICSFSLNLFRIFPLFLIFSNFNVNSELFLLLSLFIFCGILIRLYLVHMRNLSLFLKKFLLYIFISFWGFYYLIHSISIILSFLLYLLYIYIFSSFLMSFSIVFASVLINFSGLIHSII